MHRYNYNVAGVFGDDDLYDVIDAPTAGIISVTCMCLSLSICIVHGVFVARYNIMCC